MKIDIRSFQMDEQIAIAATYRAITAVHLVVRQGGRSNSKGDSAAMTTGSVRDEFLVGRRHVSSYGSCGDFGFKYTLSGTVRSFTSVYLHLEG